MCSGLVNGEPEACCRGSTHCTFRLSILNMQPYQYLICDEKLVGAFGTDADFGCTK